jgi:tetratricopeptide (TPR) repeat protein
MDNIPGQLFERAQQAVVDAFNVNELETFARAKLGLVLSRHVNLKEPFKKVVFDVLSLCERDNRLLELLDRAAEDRPNSPKLRKVAAEVGGLLGRLPSLIPSVVGDEIPLLDLQFTGREIDARLDELRKHLGNHYRVALTGQGGVGKTALARRYVEVYCNCYQEILWVPAAGSLKLTFQRMAVGAGWIEKPSWNLDSDAERIKQRLHGPEPRLLVLDDAPDEESVQGWVPRHGGCHTLATSRYTGWSAHVHPMGIPILDREPAGELLIRLAGRGDDAAEREAAERLAKRLGRLPLALRMAADYVRNHKISFDCFLLYYAQDPDRVLKGLVATIMRAPFDRIGALARAIFRVTSFLPVDTVQLSLLVEAEELLRRGARDILQRCVPSSRAPASREYSRRLREQDLREGLVELERYSLGTLGETTFSVHTLVREVQARALKGDERKTWLGVAVGLLNSAFPTKTEDPDAWVKYPSVFGAINPSHLLGAPAAELGMLYFNLGNLYRKKMSDLNRALKYFNKGFELWNSVAPSPTGQQASRVHRYHGDLRRLRGELGEAAEAYQTALGFMGPGEPGERGKVLSSQAELYARYATEPGHLKLALNAARLSVKCQERAKDRFELFQSHRVLADVYVTCGKPIPALRHVMIAEGHLPRKDHPHKGWLLRTKGEVHQMSVRLDDALGSYEEAHQVFVQDEHQAGRAVALKKIASVQMELGQFEDAVRNLDAALDVLKTVSGEEYLLAVVLLARIHAGLKLGEKNLRRYHGRAQKLLFADGSRAPTTLGRILLRPTQPGYRVGRTTRLAAFAKALGGQVYESC